MLQYILFLPLTIHSLSSSYKTFSFFLLQYILFLPLTIHSLSSSYNTCSFFLFQDIINLHISFKNVPIYTLKLRFNLSHKWHLSWNLTFISFSFKQWKTCTIVLDYNILKKNAQKIFPRHLVLVIYSIED